MAVIAAAQVGYRQFVGDEVEITFRTTANTQVANAAEWIATGLSKITKVTGHSVHGATTSGVNFVMNAQGTGVTEDTNPGDLGVEAGAAVQFQVTVRGRL